MEDIIVSNLYLPLKSYDVYPVFNNKRLNFQVPWNTVAWGLILQFSIGFLTIRWSVGRNALETFSDHVNTFLDYGVEAAAFTYGDYIVNELQVFAFRVSKKIL